MGNVETKHSAPNFNSVWSSASGVDLKTLVKTSSSTISTDLPSFTIHLTRVSRPVTHRPALSGARLSISRHLINHRTHSGHHSVYALKNTHYFIWFIFYKFIFTAVPSSDAVITAIPRREKNTGSSQFFNNKTYLSAMWTALTSSTKTSLFESALHRGRNPW